MIIVQKGPPFNPLVTLTQAHCKEGHTVATEKWLEMQRVPRMSVLGKVEKVSVRESFLEEKNVQGMEEHLSSQDFTPGFRMSCRCPLVLTLWGRCHLYTPLAPQEMGSRRKIDFPKVTQLGLRLRHPSSLSTAPPPPRQPGTRCQLL